MDEVRVAIIGGSGYTGGELLRIFTMHNGVNVTHVTSREFAGKPIHYVHPNLRGYYRLNFSEPSIDKVIDKADVVFLSLPHKVSLNYVPKFLEVGIKIVDLSADFRLKNPRDYVIWYGYEHPFPDLLNKAVYGMPELHRDELKKTNLIAVPGCNATASLLALIPLVKERMIELDRIVIDVKASSSEGGSKPSPGRIHPEKENSIRPYSVSGHRHVAEVEQELKVIAGRDVSVGMSLHAVSSVRGALATVHSWALTKPIDDLMLWRVFAKVYGKEPFIRIVRSGVVRYPDTKYVLGSNYADVGFAIDKRLNRIVTLAAIDNLMKGAAGQAVQSFNIMVGFEEIEGLKAPPTRP